VILGEGWVRVVRYRGGYMCGISDMNCMRVFRTYEKDWEKYGAN